MNALTLSNTTFPQGRAPVSVITIDDKPWFVARQVGAALGYADDSRLPRLVMSEWSDQMEEGRHYKLLKGEELKAFKEQVEKAQLEPCHGSSSLFGKRAPSLLLLTEAGLYVSILLSKSEVGVAFMNWLTLDVLPMIRGTGMYLAQNHPMRPLVVTLAVAGYFDDPDKYEDKWQAVCVAITQAEVAKAFDGVYAALRRRLPAHEKMGLLGKPKAETIKAN